VSALIQPVALVANVQSIEKLGLRLVLMRQQLIFMEATNKIRVGKMKDRFKQIVDGHWIESRQAAPDPLLTYGVLYWFIDLKQ